LARGTGGCNTARKAHVFGGRIAAFEKVGDDLEILLARLQL
jgi:hypothetical protein